MSFTIANWACVSGSLSQGQETVTPLGGSPTILNAPNLFAYGSPNDDVATISSSGYFNSLVPGLSVGDWILGIGTDGPFSVVVTSITSGVVDVASTTGAASGTAASRDASDITQQFLASVDSPVSVSNIPTFTDANGTLGDSGINASTIPNQFNSRATRTSDIGGNGAGPISVPVVLIDGFAPSTSSIVTGSIQSSSNPVSIILMTATDAGFDITFSGDPGASCFVNYIYYANQQ